MKYAVVSDLHCHSWSLFAKTNPDGVNSRLQHILDELERAADELIRQGGSVMVLDGDAFHVRGVIDPEVLNPVRECFARIRAKGISIEAIPGNHDLKSRKTRELSSAIQNLADEGDSDGNGGVVGHFRIHNKPTVIAPGASYLMGFVPWCETHEELHQALAHLKAAAGPHSAKMDVFGHAGIDGVLSGVSASGLTPSDLAAYGFRRVIFGHYHNHADMGDGIYSAGASTHHNWGDVGTRAGFLIVDTDPAVGRKGVVFHDNMAPHFVDLEGLDETEMEIECKGAYVRFRGPEMTQQEINDLRKTFESWGALGVSIQVPLKVAQSRATATASTAKTLDQSVADFVDASTTIPASVDRARVKTRAAEVLNRVRTVVEET